MRSIIVIVVALYLALEIYQRARSKKAKRVIEVYAIPREINGKPILEITKKLQETFNEIEFAKKIVIPDAVTSIGEGAFDGCKKLTSVVIPDSVTSIGASAFSNCVMLETIETSSTNANFQTIDGVLFTKDGKTLLAVPGGKEGKFVIPGSVTSIGASAFWGCTSLTSVVIPESVTSIEKWTFAGCESLTSVEIPDSVTSIGDYAFIGCESLTSVKISDSVTSIGYSAFSCCKSLTRVEIPDSVTSIGDYAFSYCESLKCVEIPADVELGHNAFPKSCRVVRRRPSR